MDEGGLYTGGSDDGSFVPFTDILFNALLGFAVMVFMAFALINPDAKSGIIDMKAEFIITVTWPDNHPDDIDVYVEDGGGNLVWYHAKEAGLMHLDRDDRGNYRDTLTINGKQIDNPLNQETVTLRGIVSGEYVINVYHYVANSAQPVPVTVKVEKINPRVSVVAYSTVMLDHRGHEETVTRFTLNDDGTISDVNSRFKSLVRQVRKPSAGNALQR